MPIKDTANAYIFAATENTECSVWPNAFLSFGVSELVEIELPSFFQSSLSPFRAALGEFRELKPFKIPVIRSCL